MKIDQINEYWNSPRVSQSLLKSYLWNKKPKSQTPFHKGKLVDCLATTPELFDQFYKVTSLIKKPSETMQVILDEGFSIVTQKSSVNPSIDYHMIDLIAIAKEKGYGNGTYKDDRIWNDILKCEAYWQELVDAQGRSVLTLQEYDQGQMMVQKLKEQFPHYFDDVEFQVPLYGEINEVECKGLVDIVKQERHGKRNIDIKYIHNITEAENQFWKLRYDIQAEFYRRLLGGDLYNPIVLFVDPNSNKCLEVEVSRQTQQAAYEGARKSRNIYVAKTTYVATVYNDQNHEFEIDERAGILDLLEMHKFYTENPDQIGKPYKLIQSNFKITL